MLLRREIRIEYKNHQNSLFPFLAHSFDPPGLRSLRCVLCGEFFRYRKDLEFKFQFG